ncbi:RapZ C-terminal domain-containing protein [Sphaerisporangium aureirubrum]|uniref:RapZ C-terminal domain-containing protein n=1 Tax=Sphaerisporangium aureirubrum TaxID=1544736 RepID=A0ABW1NJZ1_9ACTN
MTPAPSAETCAPHARRRPLSARVVPAAPTATGEGRGNRDHHPPSDAPVAEHVMTTPGAAESVRGLAMLVLSLLPDLPEGQTVRVAIGCVGGRHRSVALAVALAVRLHSVGFGAEVEHRDITKPVLSKGHHR